MPWHARVCRCVLHASLRVRVPRVDTFHQHQAFLHTESRARSCRCDLHASVVTPFTISSERKKEEVREREREREKKMGRNRDSGRGHDERNYSAHLDSPPKIVLGSPFE